MSGRAEFLCAVRQKGQGAAHKTGTETEIYKILYYVTSTKDKAMTESEQFSCLAGRRPRRSYPRAIRPPTYYASVNSFCISVVKITICFIIKQLFIVLTCIFW